jgi:hypothetical protein
VARRRRRSRRRFFALGAALVGSLAFGAGIASAGLTHPYEGSFGGPAGPFPPFPVSIAVDNSDGPGGGSVYVGRQDFFAGTAEIYKFDEDGTYADIAFDGGGTPQGGFLLLAPDAVAADSVAVDGSPGPNAGDVYVVDVEHAVVHRFDEDGEFDCQITGKPLAERTSEEAAAECAGATGSEIPTGRFYPNAVAVDPVDGDVHVADAENRAIHRFDASGSYAGRVADPRILTPGGLAVDADGNLFLVNVSPSGGGIAMFDPGGSFVREFGNAEKPASVTVDRATGHVYSYLTGPEEIGEYDQGGALLGVFGHDYLLPAIAANRDSGRVYVTRVAFPGDSAIDVYGGAVTIPDAFTRPADEIEESTATLHAEVDPAGGGDIETCEFEYGPTASYGKSAPCAEALPYASPTAVSAQIAGLSPSTTYHYRVVAANANGVAAHGEDETFATKGPPTIAARSAGDITRYTARLKATINPHGYSTQYVFRYVDQAQYGVDGFASARSTAPMAVGSQLTPQEATSEVSGLAVGTSYRFKVVATSARGTAESSEAVFKTQPVAELGHLYPSGEGTSALLRESVNPLGIATSCRVEYISDAAFGTGGWAAAATAPCTPADLGAGFSTVLVHTKITGLRQDTAYHSRFVISNASGTMRTPDRTFTTFGLKRFTMAALDEEGAPVTQAGAHPYELTTEIEVNTNSWVEESGQTGYGPTATLKDFRGELPQGVVGNLEKMPQCPRQVQEEQRCPANTQVGLIGVREAGGQPDGKPGWSPLFNMTPPKGVAAEFGAVINLGISATVQIGVRTGRDHGVDANSLNITSFANVGLIRLKLWGNPGDPAHTVAGERYCANGDGHGYQAACAPAGLPETPLLTLPTHCSDGPLAVGGSVSSYQEPENPISISTEMEPVSGCEAIEFEPTLEARPTTNLADSPTGLHVDVQVPQNETEAGLRVADLRDAEVTLPPGLVINPAGANGLVGCAAEAFDQQGAGPGNCPGEARIGTAAVETPLIGHPLPGSIYLARPYDNPFRSLLAIYIEINDPVSGVIVKLAGQVRADPQSGRLSTTFDENPQLPFESFELDFFNGPRAPLQTPAVCGRYETTSVLMPWSAPESGPAPSPADSYGITQAPGGGACPSDPGALRNAPGFEAGTVSPRAGAYSPMVLKLRRDDGTQEFGELTIAPPPGLLARLAGTSRCPDSTLAAAAQRRGAEEAALPSCPAGSRVGTVQIGAGAGPDPYYAGGQVYLAGPYKDAPLSLAIVTPATAGPFDLGTVVTRAAIHIDPVTTQVTAVTDPIPKILDGIPLDVRSIAVSFDKPGFARNPTSCEPMSILGSETSVLGQQARLVNRFQVGHCAGLRFRPRFAFRVLDGLRRNDHPRLRAILRAGPEEAGMAAMTLTLPQVVLLDIRRFRRLCDTSLPPRRCPRDSRLGHIRLWSSLVDDPFEGPVYMRTPTGRLPDLVADLRADHIHIVLHGHTTASDGRLRIRLPSLPDAGLSRAVFTLDGGRRGLLVNSEALCSRHRAHVALSAQNGKGLWVNRRLRHGRRCRPTFGE